MKILIADDEASVCSVLRYQIEKYPIPFIELEEVKNGIAFKEKCINWNPDIAFVDIRMPGINGLEAITQIRELNNCINTNFIILTGYGEFEYAREALRLRVNDFLLKPSKVELVHKIINDKFKKEFLGISINTINSFDNIKEIELKELSLIIQELSKNFKFEENIKFKENIEIWYKKAILLNLEIEENFFVEHFSKNYSLDISKQKEIIINEINKWYKNNENEGFSIDLKKYINKNFTDPNLNLESLANYFGFTAQYMSIIFKNEIGDHFINYLTEKRMERAKYLLSNSQKKIKEISSECGYYYPSYFIKVFNKAEKMTPIDYRKKIRGDNN